MFFRYTKFTQDDKLLGIRVHAFFNFVSTTLFSQYLGLAGFSEVSVSLTTTKVFEGIWENPEKTHAHFQRESRV